MAIAEDANGNSNSHNSSGGGKTSSDPASQAATMAMHIAAAINEQSPGDPVKPVRGAGGAGNGSGSGGGGGGGGQGSGGAGLVPGPTIPNAATPAVAPHEPDDDDDRHGNDNDSSNNSKNNSSSSGGRRVSGAGDGGGGGGVGRSKEQESDQKEVLQEQMDYDTAKEHKLQKLELDGEEEEQQQQQRQGGKQQQQQQQQQKQGEQTRGSRGEGGDYRNHNTTKEAHDAKDDEVSCPWEKVRKEVAAASMDREPGPAPPPGDIGRGKLAPARAPSGGTGSSSSSSGGGVLSSVSGKTLAAGSSNVVITPLTRVYIEDLLDEVRRREFGG